jgi:hypothetical protein
MTSKPSWDNLKNLSKSINEFSDKLNEELEKFEKDLGELRLGITCDVEVGGNHFGYENFSKVGWSLSINFRPWREATREERILLHGQLDRLVGLLEAKARNLIRRLDLANQTMEKLNENISGPSRSSKRD